MISSGDKAFMDVVQEMWQVVRYVDVERMWS